MPKRNPGAPQRHKPVTQHKSGWSPEEWAADTSLSRSTVFAMLKNCEIKSVKFGGRTIITTSPAEFLSALAERAA